MTLGQLIAKLIDLEIEHGDKPALVRDGQGVLRPAGEVAVVSESLLTYVEIGPEEE